jgi:hypothetical protein
LEPAPIGGRAPTEEERQLQKLASKKGRWDSQGLKERGSLAHSDPKQKTRNLYMNKQPEQM